jgi:hypothetical protein
MRDEYINQFGHLWKTFKCIINDFDNKSWIQLGFGLTTPSRTAFHIIQSTKYYIQDFTPIIYKTGKSFEADTGMLKKEELPTKEDIIFIINTLKVKTEKWLLDIDFSAKNEGFEWTGKTMLSVILFLLRHSQFHLGEINSLLNEHLKGKAEDHWVNTL